VIARSQTSRVGEFVGGKYRILRRLAEGGMGVVYEAQHAVVKRRFAVKFLHPDLTDRREILTRFHREAQAAGALESENIAAAIDFGMLGDGTPYIVMEYLVGESLGSLLVREKSLPVGRAADLCLQACRGMEAAHASGIIHRDLKPENLFVCRRDDGTDLLKVLDFGIAKLEQLESNNAATRTGTILGTPAYMSPEQARGDKTIDHRTDVYGIAAILFEMLSGQKPHPGDSHNAILHHISTQPAVPLHSVKPDLPAPLLEAVERALSSDPSQRHDSVEAFGRAVAPFAKREVWPTPKNDDAVSGADAASSTPRGRLHGIPAAAEAARLAGPTLTVSGQPSRPRRRPRAAVVLGAGLVMVAGVSAIVIGQGKLRHSAPTPPAVTGGGTLLVPEPSFGAVQPWHDGDPQAEPEIPAVVERESPPSPDHPTLTRKRSRRPPGRPVERSGQTGDTPHPAVSSPATTESRTAQPAFDPQNPYGN
jgi:eukaryotic-like serine/threonine-protein kinase